MTLTPISTKPRAEANDMDPAKFKDILDKHAKWRAGKDGGERADLRDAYLRGANLRDADLGSDSIIVAGPDQRGYLFLANLRDGVVRVAAGCRYSTLSEAWDHWRERHTDPLRAEIHAKLTLIETVAKVRGWPIGATAGEIKKDAI